MAGSQTSTTTPGKLALERGWLYGRNRFCKLWMCPQDKFAIYLCGTPLEVDRHVATYLKLGFPIHRQIIVEVDSVTHAQLVGYCRKKYPGLWVVQGNIVDVAREFRGSIGFLDMDGTDPIVNNNYGELEFLEQEVASPSNPYIVAICDSRKPSLGARGGQAWLDQTAGDLGMRWSRRYSNGELKVMPPTQREILQAHLQRLAAPGVVIDQCGYRGVGNCSMMAFVIDTTKALPN